MSAIRKNTTPAMQAVRYAVLGILTVLFLLPFYVLVRNAFASNKLITAPRWQWLPDQWNFDNFAALFADDNVGMLPALFRQSAKKGRKPWHLSCGAGVRRVVFCAERIQARRVGGSRAGGPRIPRGNIRRPGLFPLPPRKLPGTGGACRGPYRPEGREPGRLLQ